MTARQKRIVGSGWLVCLIFSVILATGTVRAVSGAEERQILNSSGVRNRELSIDPVRKNEGYSTVLYDIRNGLPTSEANAIAQTSEGFIWIGSYAGLIRYDGTAFERMDSTTGISSVRCLFVDSLDRLWIGTNDSGVFLMEKDNIRSWNKSDGMDSVSIRSIIEEDGLIYIGSTAGIAMIDENMSLTVLKDERVAEQTIADLRKGADGLIYGLTSGGDLFTVQKGKILAFLSRDECRVKNILSIYPDPKHPGDLYLGTGDSVVYRGSMEENFSTLGIIDVYPLDNVDSFEYIDGGIWLCTRKGIGVLDSMGFHRLTNMPMSSSVGHVMTDYEGNLWFSSTRQGIMKIVPNQFSDLFERHGLEAAVVNTTCMYNSQLFIGTDSGLIVLENRKRVETLPLTQAQTADGTDLETDDLLSFLDGVRIRSIIRDSKDRLWISTWRRYGLLLYDQGKVTAFTPETGLFSDQVRAVSECRDGSILVANTGGVSVIRENRVEAGYGEEDGISSSAILTVTEGFDQEIVLGTDGGGIYVIADGKTKHIGTEDGLNSDVIMRIKRSPLQNVYWIVTSNSLAFMTPDFKVTTVQKFPYPNNYDLYENSRGDMWVLSSSGIYVISEKSLLANGEIDPVFFGISSGLPYVATANSYSEQTPGGDLYIAGSSGVIKVNMEKPFEDLSDLKVTLPYIDADGTRLYPDSDGGFIVPGGARRLTLYPFVFNFSLTDPLVSYRLKGFDQENTTQSRSRMTPLNYTNLGLGAFDFIMTVKDPVGFYEKTVSFRIVNGKEITTGTVGTLTMLYTSLLLLTGIFIYTLPYRSRRHIEDRLFYGIIWTNIILDVGALVAHHLEYMKVPMGKVLITAGETVYFVAYVTFPWLIWLYFDYRRKPDQARIRRRKILSGIPCFVMAAIMILNIKTGWIFSISERNGIQLNPDGRMAYLPMLPVCVFLFLSMVRVYQANKRMGILGVVLFAGRLVGGICCPDISATSLFYTMMIVCIHLYVMYQPMKEVAL